LKVRIFRDDEQTVNAKKQLPSFANLEPILATEVPARQQLNADYALLKAKQDGIEWLIHLDADELFYLQPPMTLQEHFTELVRDHVGSIIYMNHEAVPEQSETIGDYFHQVSLFRRNLNSITFNSQSQKCIDYWRSKTHHHQYMISYDNGKAATRIIPGARAAGVHAWSVPTSSPLQSEENLYLSASSSETSSPASLYDAQRSPQVRLRNVSSLADVRTLDLSKLYQCDKVFILHFVVCGLYWYLKKYKILDAFPNTWFGGKLQIHPCFHLDSRDRFLSGDFESLKSSYRKEVVMDDGEEIERQLESGVCMRVEGLGEAICAQHRKLFNSEYFPVSVAVPYPDQLKRGTDAIPNDTHRPATEKKVGESLPLEKMWVLSSLISQYLKPSHPD